MKLVTVATHSEGYFPWLFKSCQRHNVQLDILGWGQKWQGFAWRLTLMMKYLEKQHPEEVVCFIDGFDVILLKPLDDLEARFLRLKEQHDFKIAVSLEIPYMRVQQWAARLAFGKCQSSLLNAGCYIGFAGDLLDVIKSVYDVNPNFNADDQQMLLTYCRKEPNSVFIDKKRELFLTLVFPLQDVNKHIASFMENDPCIYHGAGNTNMNSFIRRLGYKMSEEEIEAVNAYNWKTQKKKIIYYCILFSPLIVSVGAGLVTVALFITYRYKACCKD